MLYIEIQPKKRSDTPYGDFSSAVALARAALEKTALHKHICECGTAFQSPQPYAKYCSDCNLERKRKSALESAKRKKEIRDARRANQETDSRDDDTTIKAV